jgi:hypothetical protein
MYPWPAEIVENLGAGADSATVVASAYPGGTAGNPGPACGTDDCPITITINGNGGNDSLWGYESAAPPFEVKSYTLNGGEGDDMITVGAVNGTAEPEVAYVSGGPGDDTVYLHGSYPRSEDYNRSVDHVECGPGDDSVYEVETQDVINADCEHVYLADEAPYLFAPEPTPPKPPENHPPVAHKDAGESTGSPTSGDVLANDTDSDGDPLTLTSYTQGAFGKVECSPSGDCTYTPGPKYTDHDSFSYTISDGRGGTSSARDFIRAHPLASDGPLVLKQSTSYDCGYLTWNFPAIEEAQFAFHFHEASDTKRCSYAWMLGPAGGRVKTACPPKGSKHYIGSSLKTHVAMDGVHPLKVCTYDKVTGEVFPIEEGVASPAYLYAPVVYLAKGETYRPGSTNEFLEHSRVVLDKPDPPSESDISKVDKSCADKTLRPEIGGGSASDLVAAKQLGKELAAYAMHPWSGGDDDGEWVCKQKSDTTRYLRKQKESETGVVLDADSSIYPGASTGELSAGKVPVYAVYVPHKYVSYWFFYPYNGYDHQFLDSLRVVELHQGDWEHITVDLGKGSSTADEDAAKDVYYYQHEHCGKPLDAELQPAEGSPPFELISPDGAFEVKYGTHPVVYSALGGHASYPDERDGHQLACRDEGLGDVANHGGEWDTFKSIDDAARQPWWGFTGNWGTKVSAKGIDAKILHYGPEAPGPKRTR